MDSSSGVHALPYGAYAFVVRSHQFCMRPLASMFSLNCMPLLLDNDLQLRRQGQVCISWLHGA